MYYETSVTIDATADDVWAVLRDVERWPDWTPTVTNARILDGELRVGGVVRLQQPKLPTAEWTVHELTPGRGFSWIAKAKGMTSVAEHWIAPAAECDPGAASGAAGDSSAAGEGGARDAVTVMLSLRQSGPLAPLVAVFMARLVRRYVDTEARGLRERCERAASEPAI